MTVIAFDGRYVAADGLCRLGQYTTPQQVQKLQRSGNTVYALSGYPAWFNAWIAWHKAGAQPHSTPVCRYGSHESGGSFVVLEAGHGRVKVEYYSHELPYPHVIAPPDAWGSGQEFAIGAMLWGASAMDAVRVAIKATPSCGGRVMAYDMLDLDGSDLTDLDGELSHGSYSTAGMAVD